MNDITFAREWMLFLIPAVLLALATWWWGIRKAQAKARSVSRAGGAPAPYLAAILFTLAAISAIGAAAQPRWGTRESRVPRIGADLIIAVDISRSMDARDVAPDRLAAAKATIGAVLDRLGGDRVGLVVFAGEARERFPLTTDFAAARQVVDTLQTGVVFVDGGTNAGLGLELAVTLLGDDPDTGKLILLLTDGDDLGGDPALSAMIVQNSGADLLVAGVGTADGATIPVYEASIQGETAKLDAAGEPIITRLNEPFLRALAAASGGRYLGSDLSVVAGAIDGRLRVLERSQIESRPTILPIERYRVFAATALGILVLGALAERFARFRLRAGAVLAMLVLLLPGCATEAYEANEAGREALQAGDAELAIAKFVEVQVERPDDPEVALNLAAAYAAAGRREEAIISARRALASHRTEIRARAYSSIGHHHFDSQRLPESLDAFRRSLLEDPSSDAARHDYEVVLRLLFPEAAATPPPDAGDGTGTPTPAPGPGSESTPPAGSGTPGGTPGPGGGSPTPGAGSGGTPTPGGGPGAPGSIAELERQLDAINAQVTRLLAEAGDTPTAQEAIEILKLLKERSELATLRGAFEGGGRPNDY